MSQNHPSASDPQPRLFGNVFAQGTAGTKQKYGMIAIGIILIGCLIGVFIGQAQDKKLNAFSAPLFDHALPEETRLVSSYADDSANDGVRQAFACLIVQSSLTQEELLAFYSDTDYSPAREGDTVTLQVLPVEGESLETLKNTKQYQEEGGPYWYIYLYSAPSGN